MVDDASARLLAAWDGSRRALERELHDGPQQHLVAVAVKLHLAEQAVDDSPSAAREMLEELRADVQATVAQLRELAWRIFPPVLADRGLAAALHAQSPLIDVSVEQRYAPDVEAAVYFACADALAGGATGVAVRDGPRVHVTGALAAEAEQLVRDRAGVASVEVSFGTSAGASSAGRSLS